ncbi:MAG TPA: hypothetical protein VF599_02060 [Pyrinomonadaceae bacterium]
MFNDTRVEKRYLRGNTISEKLIDSKFLTYLLFIILFAGFTEKIFAAPGHYDSSFGNKGKVITPFSYADNCITSALLQPDGKLLTAGYRYNGGLTSAVRRYNANGSLDSSFGMGGTFSGYSTFIPFSMALQSDGKILIAGFAPKGLIGDYWFVIGRLLPNGAEDPSFGTFIPYGPSYGYVYTRIQPGGNGAYAVAVQPDGKIIVGGHTKAPINGGGYTPADSVLIRVNSDGSPDDTFGIDDLDGKIVTDFGGDDEIRAISILPDGKILVAGKADTGSDSNFVVARYNSDGSLDTAFGNAGKSIADFGNNVDEVRGMRIQGDGKIVAVGNSFDGTQNDFAVARFNSNGSLDSSFGVSGKIVTNVSGKDDLAGAVALQADGKIVVTGKSISTSFPNYDFSAVRYNGDGALDNTFGTGGRVFTPISDFDDGSLAAVIQPDGKIISAGLSSAALNQAATVIRYDTDGYIDTSFGTNGRVISGTGIISHEAAEAVDQQADGKIVVVGNTYAGADNNFAVTRYNKDGSLDGSFGTGGKVKTPIRPTRTYADLLYKINFDSAKDAIIQPDGKIIVVGQSYNQANEDIALVRYNTNGTLDTSFGSQGKVVTDINNRSDAARSVVLQPDGKILVAGGTRELPFGSQKALFARYNQNGSLDTSFGNGGIAIIDPVDAGIGIKDMILQPDGKIVVGGNYATYVPTYFSANLVARYNSNGTPDTSFGNNGIVLTQVSNSTVYKFEALETIAYSNGKIVAAGEATFGQHDYNNTEYFLVRFESNGTIDTSFGNAGLVITDFGPYRASTPTDLEPQSGGKILAVGYTHNRGYTGSFEVSMARYTSSGALDTTFADGGKFYTDYGGLHAAAFDAKIQSDGKILVAGRYDWDDTGEDIFVARYQDSFNFFDYDGDSKSDLSYFRPDAQATWSVKNSSTNTSATTPWGSNGDKIVPADYDNDGRTDFAVFRPSTGEWHVLKSSNSTFFTLNHGQAGDLLVAADYDGDKKADAAFFRNGFWHILKSSDQQLQVVQFGLSTDKPVVGDFDGDGKADLNVYRNGVWYSLGSTQGFYTQSFGLATDKPVAADYDGDGKTDIAVFRPSTGDWWILQSSNLNYYSVQWGVASDIPVPADYDGDLKTDWAVVRDGVWYILHSSDFTYRVDQFGLTTDIPTPSAYLP